MPRQNVNALGRTLRTPRVVGTGSGTWSPSRFDRNTKISTTTFFATDHGSWGPVADLLVQPKAVREAHPDRAVVVIDRRDDAGSTPRFFSSKKIAAAYAATLVRL